MKKILFVCTGNVCRSPMAEGLLRHMLRGRNDIQVASAGLGALKGQGATDVAIDVTAELGIDISSHVSQPLGSELVHQADFILTMTRQHYDAIQALHPTAAEKTFLVREFEELRAAENKDIADPIGQSTDVYRRTRDQIRDALPSLIVFIDQTAGPTGQTTREVAAATSDKTRALRIALASNCFYVGALGSAASQVRRVERLKARGVTADALARLRAPIGLDIGAVSPTEIAVAVMGEIVLTRRRKPLRAETARAAAR